MGLANVHSYGVAPERRAHQSAGSLRVPLGTEVAQPIDVLPQHTVPASLGQPGGFGRAYQMAQPLAQFEPLGEEIGSTGAGLQLQADRRLCSHVFEYG